MVVFSALRPLFHPARHIQAGSLPRGLCWIEGLIFSNGSEVFLVPGNLVKKYFSQGAAGFSVARLSIHHTG